MVGCRGDWVGWLLLSLYHYRYKQFARRQLGKKETADKVVRSFPDTKRGCPREKNLVACAKMVEGNEGYCL